MTGLITPGLLTPGLKIPSSTPSLSPVAPVAPVGGRATGLAASGGFVLSGANDSMDPMSLQSLAGRHSLVGREQELAEILRVVDLAGEGTPGAVLLGGDAGVGKTRLISELAALAADRGATVLIGHCVNLPDGMLPYVPFVDAFRRLDSAAWQTLEPHLRGGRGEQFGQLQLFEAVVEVLAEMAGQAPVLLILEDLHWSDRPSRELIGYLLNRLRDERVALLLTYRSDDVHRRHPLQPFLAETTRHPLVHRTALEPLGDTEIGSLVGALVSRNAPAGTRPSAAVLRDIIARAEGNAFFAEELLEASLSMTGSARLPSGLADVLIARLDLLAPAAQRVVGVAAVAGRRVGHDLLAEVTDLPQDELDEALRDAVARHILVPGDSAAYQFRHALLQEAAYEDLLPGERVRVHATYAALFEARRATDPSMAAEVAYHAERSHDIGLALSSSVHAAAYARSVYAPSEAYRHLDRALQWWSAVPDAAQRTGTTEPALQIAAGDAASVAGDSLRAVQLLEAAAENVDREADLALWVRATSRLAHEQSWSGSDELAIASAQRAANAARELPVSFERADALATLASITFAMVQDDDPRTVAEEARENAVAAGSVATEAVSLVVLARITDREGDSDTSAAYLRQALDLSRRAGDVAAELRTLFNLAMGRYDAGDLRGALHWAGVGLTRAAETGTPWSTYARETLGIQILASYAAGEWDAALEQVRSSVEKAPSTATQSYRAMGLYPAVGRGLPDVLQLVDAVESARHPDRFEDAQLHMIVTGTLIDHHTWTGRPELAVRLRDERIEYPVEAWGEEHYLGRIWLDALALGALGDLAQGLRGAGGPSVGEQELRDRGEAIVDDARAAAKFGTPRGGRLGAEGKAWLARAESEWTRVLGEDDAASWESTVAAFGYGYVYEQARSRWRLAEVLVRLGRLDEATEQLRTARRTAAQLGALPLLGAIDGLARRARIAGVGDAAPAAGDGSGPLLTPREQEVLRLLAEGSTNRQLGTALFISEKTASVHVSNIMGKLGAGSRGEAVAAARRRGLL